MNQKNEDIADEPNPNCFVVFISLSTKHFADRAKVSVETPNRVSLKHPDPTVFNMQWKTSAATTNETNTTAKPSPY